MPTPHPIIENLTLKPYAQSLFTDFERGKTFLTLYWRFKGRTRTSAVAFTEKVLDSLSKAGITPSGKVAVDLSPDTQSSWHCHLRMQVEGWEG